MMRQLIGAAAAVAVFMIGAPAAHAIQLVDEAEQHPADSEITDGPLYGMDSVTYAKETLVDTVDNTTPPTDEADETEYYNIVRMHYVTGPADIAATEGSESEYTVSYVLEGMVFASTATAMSRGVQIADDGNITVSGGAALDPITGGGAGDTMAVYQAGGAIDADDLIELTATFAISGEGSGTISRTVRNRSLQGVPGIAANITHTLAGAIKAKPALKQTIKPKEPAPQAMAAFGYKAFHPSTASTKKLTDWVGYVQVGVKPHRNAQVEDGLVAVIADIAGPDITTTDSLNVLKNNTVTFLGDFSFVETLALSGDVADDAGTENVDESVDGSLCDSAADIRKPSADDPEEYTDVVPVILLNTFTTAQYLCITVDGEEPIPATDADKPYMVAIKYTGIDDAAFPPPGGTFDLAGITRDGTYFHIPYLTTYEGYNQRIIIVNRGSDSTYAFDDFNADIGTAMAGMSAEGMLPEGQTVLTASQVVDIMDGNRASATLSIPAPSSTISAAIQQVNTGTRGVDTVYLTHGR